MSMPDIEDATRDLTTADLREIIRRGRGQVPLDLAVPALLGRNQLRPVEAARTILEARENTVDHRREAIRALGRTTERGAQDLLIRHLEEPDPRILRDTVWSLARIGDDEALDRLRQVDERRAEGLQHELRAARRLLAFRLGRPGFGFADERLPERAEFSRDEVQEMKISSVDRGALERGRKRIALDAAGLDLVPEVSTQATCLREDFWMIPGKRAIAEPETLKERPAVAMAIFNFNGCTGVPFLKSYVLSEPAEDGIRLVVTRLRGQATHAGTLKVDGGEIRFDLGALRTRYDPAARIAGRVTREGSVVLETAQVSTAVAEQLKRRLKPRETAEAPRRPRAEARSVV